MTKDFGINYGMYQITAVLLNIAALAAIILLPWTHVAAAVIFYVITMPIVQLIFHDYASHNNIIPKNQTVEAVCLWIFCVLGGRLNQKFAYHRAHHQHWCRPELDPTQQKIHANQFWSYVFGTGCGVPQSFEPHIHPLIDTSKTAKFVDRHANIIQLVTLVVALVLLPLEIFAVVFVLYPWMLMIVFSYHDWYFHGPKSKADNCWWFLLWNNACWHVHHHRNPNELYFGPSGWKWFNISWYTFRSFFRAA